MAITGSYRERSIAREWEVIIRVCDICGERATHLMSCQICGRDLCEDHLIFSDGREGLRSLRSTSSPEYAEVEAGGYCKECLLKRINEVFR